MEACLEKREPAQEGIEAMEEHQEVHNEEAAVYIIGASKD
jgi:hypothetical protein